MQIELTVTTDAGNVARMRVEVSRMAYSYLRNVLLSEMCGMFLEEADDLPHGGRHHVQRNPVEPSHPAEERREQVYSV